MNEADRLWREAAQACANRVLSIAVASLEAGLECRAEGDHLAAEAARGGAEVLKFAAERVRNMPRPAGWGEGP